MASGAQLLYFVHVTDVLCPGQQDTSNAEGDAEPTGTDRRDKNKLKATLIGDIKL